MTKNQSFLHRPSRFRGVGTPGLLALLLCVAAGGGAGRAGEDGGVMPLGLDDSDPLHWVIGPEDPNPYTLTVGSGPNTPGGFPGHVLTVLAEATVFPTGSHPAISVSDDWTIEIFGTVQNQANGGGGLWNAGPNTIESRSNTTIIIRAGGQVLATGNASNGEAINLIGNYNTIVNHGLIQSRTGAAIWFQDTVLSPSNSNIVDNYGIVRTLRGSNSSAIGNSGNNGVVFTNREGALVDGGLSFAGGDDTLTFEPDSTVTGNINGGGGTNALVLQGKNGSDDSLAGALQNFTTLTKTGEGQWTITGSLAGFTTVGIEEGTLRLTGDNTGYNGSVIINSTGHFSQAVLEAKARSLPTTTNNVGNITNDGVLRFVDSRMDDDGGIGRYAGQITGTGLVEVAGDGVVTLTNRNNTYQGGTYVKNGTLNVIADATLGDAHGKIVLGDGAPGQTPTAGTLQFGAAFNLAGTREISLVGAGGTIDTNGFNTTISQGIIGGTLTKAGDGTLVLTGTNDYVGGTFVAGGTLQVGDGATRGSIHYQGAIGIMGEGAALAINRSDGVDIAARITGAGKFIQRGSGTTTLTAANTYGGGTDIENGVLAVGDNANLGSGGPLAFGTATTGGTLRMDGDVDLSGRNVALNAGGGTIDTNGFRGSSGGVITGVGALTKAGDGTLTLTGNSTYAGGTTIAQGALQLGDGGTTGGIVGNVANNGSLIFNRSDNVNSLALAGVISGTGNLVQRGTGTTALSGGNTYSGGTVIENGTLAINADAALGAAAGSLTFGTATTGGTLKLTGDIASLAARREVTIRRGGGTIDTNGHDATVAVEIKDAPGGAGHLTKTGDGTLTLTAGNTYTGGTTVAGGELELGNNGSTDRVIGNVDVWDTGTVVYNRADDNTDPAGLVSGTGNVIQRGDGVTTITQVNTYTGSTTLEGGTLAISRDANLGRGGAVVFDGGALRFNANLTDFDANRRVTLQSGGTIDTQGHTGTIGAVIGGAGTLRKEGTGELILTGDNTYTGNTTIANGTLRIGNGGGTGRILGNVANSGTLIFDRTGTGTYPGVISGSGNVVQRGGSTRNGTTVFTSNNTYLGGTTIESGTLQLGNGGTAGGLVGNVANAGALAFNRSDTYRFGGVISGTGAVNQIGPGTTILTANNTYQGGTNISRGALQLGDGGVDGWIEGDVFLSNGGLLIFNNSGDKTGAVSAPGAYDGAFAGLVTGYGSVVKSGANHLELTANNTFTGGTELRQGGLLMTNAAALGTMTAADGLAGHVLFSDEGSGGTRTFEVDDAVTALTNHFHVAAGLDNVFQVNGNLTISGVTNNSTRQASGGAFYVAGGATLDLNVGRTGQGDIDLTLNLNRDSLSANDFYVEDFGNLNLNLTGDAGDSRGNAVFVDSGIDGKGRISVNGAGGPSDGGLVQISKDSQAKETFVTGTVMRLVDGMRFANSVYNQDSGSALQGNGTMDVAGDARNFISISGTISPDGATFATGRDVVDFADRVGTLTLTGGATRLDTFTFVYNAVAANSDANPALSSNDLVRFGSQNVTINGGTVNFVTDGSAGLAGGRYLVFSSDAATYLGADGRPLNHGTLNDALKGTVNGVSLATDSPRMGYDFNFGDYNGQSRNQIWLEVNRNTLQTVWQGGVGAWQPGNWESIQHNGTAYANDFNDGDLAIFNNNSTGAQKATLGSNVLVSGLQIDTVDNNILIADIEIAGVGDFTARKTDPAHIVGKYANGVVNESQRFTTTGKLEMRGITDGISGQSTTLTISNSGVNAFEEGIDLYGGRIVLKGLSAEGSRLGEFGALSGHANAGLVAFKTPDPLLSNPIRTVEIAGQAQRLVNRFVVDANLRDNRIVARGVTATITGITSALSVDGAIELGSGSTLELRADHDGTNKGNLILVGNGTTDVNVGQGASLHVAGAGNTFVRSGIHGATDSELIKESGGTLQIEADSDVDYIGVYDGMIRVFKNRYLGNADTVLFDLIGDGVFEPGSRAYIAGGGTVRAKGINLVGHISPDDLDASDATKGSRYGTLTFDGVGATPRITLSGIALDFDVDGPTEISGVSQTNRQDLLAFKGAVVTIDGSAKSTVYFNTAGGTMKRGEYLVMTSENGFSPLAIDGVLGTGPLEAYINGRKAPTPGSTPRGTVHFKYDTAANAAGEAREIWLVSSLNSLTMDWTGGVAGGPTSGSWDYTDGRFQSLQEINVGGTMTPERQFLDGDKVHIATNATLSISLQDANDAAFFPTVSGLVVGRTSGGDDSGAGDITITGKGGLTADATAAFGDYINNGNPDALAPTGKLEKTGLSTLTFLNDGANTFAGGIEIGGGGTVEFTHGRQLQVGAGQAITFVGNGHFASVETAKLGTGIVIEAGQVATFGSNASDGTLILDGTVSGPGTFHVTSETVQLNQDSGTLAETRVAAGTLRLLSGKTNTSLQTRVNAGATLAGAGTYRAGEITVNGIISPDRFVDDVDADGEALARAGGKYAVLTLATLPGPSQDTTLDGFSFDYDVLRPNASGDNRNSASLPNDLLAITGNGPIRLGTAAGTAGTIHFRTDTDNNVTTLAQGKYLIIDADGAITLFGGAASPGDVLGGTLNGADFATLGPRTGHEFRFNDVTVESNIDRAQVWLDVERNTLQSVWQGGDGVWSTGGWKSVQFTGTGAGAVYDSTFNNGDLVYFNNGGLSGGATYTVTLDGDVVVSGLDAQNDLTGAAGITLGGSGGITAIKDNPSGTDYIHGQYAKQNGANAAAQEFDTTGRLVKKGSGTLTLSNTGRNVFQEGIDVYAGTLALAGTQADRLGTYGTVGGHANAGLVTFKNNAPASPNPDATNRSVVIDTAQTMKNRFVVEDRVTGAYITANAQTTISGVAGDADSGAIRVGDAARLVLTAERGDLTMGGNQTSAGSGNDISLDLGAQVAFHGADHHHFIQSGIAGSGTVEKYDGGMVQIAADSNLTGATNLYDGTFRVVGDRRTPASVVTYGDAAQSTFHAVGPASGTAVTVAGGGVIAGQDIVIGRDAGTATLSPDSATLSSGNATVADADRFGTLTLQGSGLGNGSTVTFASIVDPRPGVNDRTGFHLDYDVNARHTSAADTTNDLLQISGADHVRLEGGVVNFRTGADGLGSGDYLVINSDTAITDVNGNAFVGAPTPNHHVLDGINNYTANGGVLWGKVNGEDIREGSPRRQLEFELREGDRQIWLHVDRNTLTMVRTQGGTWGTSQADELWKSEQSNNPTGVAGRDVYDYVVERGDYAKIYNPSGDAFTLTGDATQILGGLQLGETGDAGDVTLAGDFGIRTVDTDLWIEGGYVDPGATGTPVVPIDGKLTKKGGHTATFANTGGNLFQEGIDLYAGTLSFNRADQLLVGGGALTGKVLDFKGSATLRADATTELKTDLVIDGGVTGTLHTGYQVGMLMDKTIAGGTAATFEKTGEGLVQLAVDSSGFDGATRVNNGTLRILGGKIFGSDTLAAGSSLDVARNGGVFGAIAGAGTFKAETITVNGGISPDSLVDQLNGTPTGNNIGTLTLRAGSVTLDGFDFAYDLGTPNPTTPPGGVTPTGDLLKIVTEGGSVELVDGSVAFRGTLATGNYLIVDSDTRIDAGGRELDGLTHLDGLLTASLDGNALSNGTPRQELLFKFENNQKQIWLEAEVNTLFVDWTGGTALWGGTAWTSRQQTISGARDGTFRNGDRVAFLDGTRDSHATLVSDVLIGGLDVNTAKTVTIDGDYWVRATKSDSNMIGEFVKTDGSANASAQQFNTTGTLRKEGAGTLVFRNAGNTFGEGIFLGGGVTGFDKAAQLGDNGKGIEFFRTSTLRSDASLELANAIRINDHVTATLEAGEDITLDFAGTLSGSINTALEKTGDGAVNLNTEADNYQGTVAVNAGTLGVYADYSRATGLVVRNGATLTGHGPNAVIGSGTTGVIRSGGTLAPRGMSAFTAGATPTVEYLTVSGDLRFNGGSLYDVTIAQYDGGEDKLVPVSDCVFVDGGLVTIDTGARLNVNYWDSSQMRTYNEEQSSRFTIIDASAGEIEDGAAQFTLTPGTVIPRGVKLMQGWRNYEDGWREHASGWLYQLWFEYDQENNFENLCDRYNRGEIGGNLDWFVNVRDPGLDDVINLLSDPDLTQPEVCGALDWLSGDLVANSLMLKKPWRHPFAQFDREPCAEACCAMGRGRHLWAEIYGRITDAESDGNAHGYSVHRSGFALGYDWRFSEQLLVGTTFNYSNPRLRQRTGKTEVDDFEFGLYGSLRFGHGFEAHGYAGYSHQRYDIRRNVRLAGINAHPAIHESFRSKTPGNTVAASLEVRRPFQVMEPLWLKPVLALDYEQAWMKGFRESGGMTALDYDNSTLRRLALRLGLQVEATLTDRLDLHARAQYERQLNCRDYGRTGVRFVNATTPGQPRADIHGVDVGRDALNLGLGMDWTFTRARSAKLYANYDADLYKNTTTHAGEIGLTLSW